MKRFIVCLIGAIILSNCEIGVKQSHANDMLFPHNLNKGEFGFHRVTVSGMEYAVFYGAYMAQAPAVVNLTNDSLEHEVLLLTIKNIRNGNSSR